MPRLLHSVVLAAVVLFLGGCCRDTIREMTSLKDMRGTASETRAVRAPAQRTGQTAKVRRDDDDDDEERIETGSVEKPAPCQGQHLAYQATKEYLKNFGPKPPDQPGELGPCKPSGP
jgi:hypothetical protein